jgi:hypothetical protein
MLLAHAAWIAAEILFSCPRKKDWSGKPGFRPEAGNAPILSGKFL